MFESSSFTGLFADVISSFPMPNFPYLLLPQEKTLLFNLPLVCQRQAVVVAKGQFLNLVTESGHSARKRAFHGESEFVFRNTA